MKKLETSKNPTPEKLSQKEAIVLIDKQLADILARLETVDDRRTILSDLILYLAKYDSNIIIDFIEKPFTPEGDNEE